MPDGILRFDRVSLATRRHHVCSVEDVSFSLERGDLMRVRVAAECDHLPLPELAMGVDFPDTGDIRFLGEKWSEAGDFARSALRGQIGFVSDTPNWISNLDVDENVMLSERHHSRRDEGEIREEAVDLAESVGLAGLPEVRPHLLHSRELRLLEWVRAFVGNPALILLACPEKGAAFERSPALAKLVEDALARGTAVLWITDRSGSREEKRLPVDMEYVMKGNKLFPAMEVS